MDDGDDALHRAIGSLGLALPLDNDIWYRLHRRLMPLAVQVAAREPENRAWIRVRPLAEEVYHVRYSEIRASDYEEVFNSYDDDLYTVVDERYDVIGDDALTVLLAGWLPDLRELKDPSVIGYPL